MESSPAYESRIAKMPGFIGAALGYPESEPYLLHPYERFPAASLIKVPILLHLLKKRQEGSVRLEEALRLTDRDKVGGSGILFELHGGIELTLSDLATLMIVVSDNTATNLLLDRLGVENIRETIRCLGMQRTILARKMMVQPNAPPANFTAPIDMYILFKHLLNEDFLSSENSRLALGILSRQQFNEKIPLLLPKELRVAHKTGEISTVRHDCGIIDDGRKPIIACFLTKDVTDELAADRIIAEWSLDLIKTGPA